MDPRKPLPDINEELYAMNRARGQSPKEAARSSGLKTYTKIEARSDVVARVKYLVGRVVQAAMAKAELTEARVLEEYARLALFNPQSCLDENGRYIPLEKLPPDVACCIKNYIWSPYPEETLMPDGTIKPQLRVTGVRVHDKLAALEVLREHFHIGTQSESNSAPQINVQVTGVFAAAPVNGHAIAEAREKIVDISHQIAPAATIDR